MIPKNKLVSMATKMKVETSDSDSYEEDAAT
jgi:hypothetical protein